MSTILYGGVFGGLVATIINTVYGFQVYDNSVRVNFMDGLIPTPGSIVLTIGILIGISVGFGYLLHKCCTIHQTKNKHKYD